MDPEQSGCVHYDVATDTTELQFSLGKARGRAVLTCRKCGTIVSLRKVSAMLEALASVRDLLKDRARFNAANAPARGMLRAIEHLTKRADKGHLPAQKGGQA